MRWVADEPPGSEVTIRTRTGNELMEEIHYYDRNGVEKTATEHKRLPRSLKGPIDTAIVAGPGWSPWSEEIEVSGGQAKSPGPRRFLMIQARLHSHDRQALPSIESLTVELLPPVAQQLGAEVWPEVATAGVLDTFEVYVQPQFLEQPVTDRSPGLDEVLLHGDPPLDLYLVDAALGTESELARGEPHVLFERRADGGLGSADGQSLRVVSEGDSLWFGLPFSVRSASSELVGRRYYRRLELGDEAPATLEDRLLSATGYLALPEDERGAIRYYHRVAGTPVEVDYEAYYELPEEELVPIRYYRIVTSLGQQTVFDARGDTLDRIGHARLGADERGWVVGPGRLLRLRFAAVAYLQSTRLWLSVRESSAAPDWQTAEGQDVTGLRPASTLVIATPHITGGCGEATADIVIFSWVSYSNQSRRPRRRGHRSQSLHPQRRRCQRRGPDRFLPVPGLRPPSSDPARLHPRGGCRAQDGTAAEGRTAAFHLGRPRRCGQVRAA